MSKALFIHALHALDHPAPAAPWVANVPAVRALQAAGQLSLRQTVTILTGDNGVGKSTLLEAIAYAYGFHPEGGTLGAQLKKAPDALAPLVTLAEGPRRKVGYFMRGETHFNVATTLGADGPGHTSMHRRSHGESVMDILSTFPADGLYLLDEPESGLSAISLMAMLAMLTDLARRGAQIVMVTHSPILLALPHAHIVQLHDDGTWDAGISFEDTIPFRALRDFLADPHGIAEYMVEVTHQ